jgi:small subunit ribosomal protein S6e
LANFKLTISDKSGKSISKELKDKEASGFIGLHLGNEIDAAIAGLAGKLKLTGGSDKSGIPMRADIYGSARKPVLISKGVGLKKVEKGQRRRRLIRGNVISEEIYQLNCSYDGELKVEEAPPAEAKA